MALTISCPECGGEFSVTELFPGGRVFCPKCNTCLILAIQTKAPQKGVTVPNPIQPTSIESTAVHERALTHLANWLDIPSQDIQSVLDKLTHNEAYAVWTIPKGESGLMREISTPCDMLKTIQRRILDRLLYRIPVSNASHGFVPSRSIVTNAKYHLKTAGAILNLDLKDAFPSVVSNRVKQIYVRYVKIPLKHLGEGILPAVLDEAIDMLVRMTTYNNQLPQGGPCSGYLLNLACITLDKNIYRLLKKYGDSYRYTRYADDITISAPKVISEELKTDVQKLIHNCGYQVNPKKSTYLEQSKGHILKVTGLVLEKNTVRIPSQKLEIFRAIIHQASQISTEQLTPEKRLEIQSIIAFVKMVYKKLPHRIWGPYKTYLEKHGISYPKKITKTYLELYPKQG